MGNSASSWPSQTTDPSVPSPFIPNPFISKPRTLEGTVRRSASTRPSSTSAGRSGTDDSNGLRNHSGAANRLSPPASNHRRSRSANATTSATSTGHRVATVDRESAPPPYSLVADIPPPKSSRVQQGGPVARSPPRNNNPFRGNTVTVAPAGIPVGSRHTQVLSIPAQADNGGGTTTEHTTTEPTTEPTTAAARSEYLRAPMRRETVENALEALRKYNTVIVVDDSHSMAGALWREARDALASLADIAAQYDADGIDVYFLNDKKVGMNMKNAVSVKRLFDSVRPRGITPIGEKLEELLLDYMLSLEHAQARQGDGDRSAMKDIKPVNYIVLTDGAPTDDPESVIVAAAKRLDNGNFPITQVGIQFVQIGNDPRAKSFLQELDDGLSSTYGIRDIVDTTPYTGGELNAEILTKILLGGINRRVDRRGGQSVLS